MGMKARCSMKPPRKNPINREQFLSDLLREFPDALGSLDESAKGLLHCEVAAFRQTVEDACHAGRAWYVERAMRFIAQAIQSADPELSNALEVSFIEDIALGEFTLEARTVIFDRSPPSILAETKKVAQTLSSKPGDWD